MYQPLEPRHGKLKADVRHENARGRCSPTTLEYSTKEQTIVSVSWWLIIHVLEQMEVVF